MVNSMSQGKGVLMTTSFIVAGSIVAIFIVLGLFIRFTHS